MLQNEQTKLQILHDAMQAQESVNRQTGKGAGHCRTRTLRDPIPAGALGQSGNDSGKGRPMGFFATFWSWLKRPAGKPTSGDNTTRLAGALEPAVVDAPQRCT